MPRQKVPLRVAYRQIAHSPKHEFPFHIVGMIEEDKRHVISGLTNEQAKEIYDELHKVFANGNQAETT